MTYEENPFEDKDIAQEWINTIENEKGTIRDKEINPILAEWIQRIKPQNVLDIGCGQGICANAIGDDSVKYIGVDPSEALIKRANEKYPKDNRSFIVANAYNLPFKNDSIDASFSITVWFHLENLDDASRELARVLKPGGHFMIVTADPDSYDLWETHYDDIKREGNKIIGSSKVLLNPDEPVQKYAVMSKNNFYTHSMEDIISSLTKYGLIIESANKIGFLPIHPGRSLFINIMGLK